MIRSLFFKLITKAGYRLESLDHRTIFGTDDFYDHWKSRKSKKPVFLDGERIPWITYPCLEFLMQYDMCESRVYEYGAGHSTHWFSNRCKEVVSIESDKGWYDYLSNDLAENVTLEFHPEDVFAKSISAHGKFDIILIDSHQREECAERALDHLNEGGIILFDNSERHPDSCELLRSKGLLQVDFKGFGPVNRYTWCTSIFYSSLTPSMSPKSGIQPTKCFGGEHTL